MSMKITRYKRDLDFSYALGATLVFELLKNFPEKINRIFFKENIKETDDIQKIIKMSKEKGIEILHGDKPFNILSPKENCFVIAEFKKSYKNLDKEKSNIVLVNPSDAGNLGTIIRTAIGLGFNNIAIIRPAVDVFDPKTIRASMGAIFHINIKYYNSFAEYQQEFSGHKCYAFMLKGASDFEKIEVKSPFSLVFGNESSGLPDEFAEICTSIKISQSSKIDSFSLPVAAAIAMYKFQQK